MFWFILTLQCTPVSFFWQRVRLLTDPTSGIHGHCLSLDSVITMAYVYSVTATLCDLTLGLLPIALVWNLQMNMRTKSALAGILGMGCVYVPALCCSCSRLTFPIAPAQQSSSVSPTCKTTKTQISSVSLSRQKDKRQPPDESDALTPNSPQMPQPTSRSGPTSKPV